jgi:uncharacterized damage-inducible protein DinB
MSENESEKPWPAGLDLGRLAELLQAARDEVVRAGQTTPSPMVTDTDGARAAAIHVTLSTMAEVAKSWAENCAQNDADMQRRDSKPAEDQQFVLGDIITMINDTAANLGVPHRWSQ